MDFFGNTLTAYGDIVGPDTLLYDPDDETLMTDIRKETDKHGWFKIGPIHALYTGVYINQRTTVENAVQHPYWVANVFNRQESPVGYNTVKQAIENNFDKIWGGNRR